MAESVYILCALQSIGCAYLLIRAYQDSGLPLLFWSALCFVGLMLNNIFLVLDLVLEPRLDFSVWRNLTGLAGCSLLLYGLLWTKVPVSVGARN